MGSKGAGRPLVGKSWRGDGIIMVFEDCKLLRLPFVYTLCRTERRERSTSVPFPTSVVSKVGGDLDPAFGAVG